MFAHVCCVTTRVTAVVWVVAVLLYGSAFKNKKKRQDNPALDNNTDDFSWKSWKKKRNFTTYEIYISDKNGP